MLSIEYLCEEQVGQVYTLAEMLFSARVNKFSGFASSASLVAVVWERNAAAIYRRKEKREKIKGERREETHTHFFLLPSPFVALSTRELWFLACLLSPSNLITLEWYAAVKSPTYSCYHYFFSSISWGHRHKAAIRIRIRIQIQRNLYKYVVNGGVVDKLFLGSDVDRSF